MAEQDLIRFLNKISQLQALAERVRNYSSSREKLAACADHNQVVQLARSWGFDIGRRWGERDHRSGGEANLLATPCPPPGDESTQVVASAETWRLLLIASNGFSSPRDEWMETVGAGARKSVCFWGLLRWSVGRHGLLRSRCTHSRQRFDRRQSAIVLIACWGLHDPSWRWRASPGLSASQCKASHRVPGSGSVRSTRWR